MKICTAFKIFSTIRSYCLNRLAALSVAGIRLNTPSNYKLFKDRLIVVFYAVRNINFHTLRYGIGTLWIRRNKKEAVFAVKIPEAKRFISRLFAPCGRLTITEFNLSHMQKLDNAHIFVGGSFKRRLTELQALLKRWIKNWLTNAFDMSDNELAKLHVRHMVGGKSQEHIKRTIYSLFLPLEYPGGVNALLTKIRWAMRTFTLVHYRNHGCGWRFSPRGFWILMTISGR